MFRACVPATSWCEVCFLSLSRTEVCSFSAMGVRTHVSNGSYFGNWATVDSRWRPYVIAQASVAGLFLIVLASRPGPLFAGACGCTLLSADCRGGGVHTPFSVFRTCSFLDSLLLELGAFLLAYYNTL